VCSGRESLGKRGETPEEGTFKTRLKKGLSVALRERWENVLESREIGGEKDG